jgi:predicted transcriptional regulator
MSPEKAKRPSEHHYFTSYPVRSEKEASWFSKKPTYSIMDLLWEAGPKGLTPAEVFASLKEDRQNVSRSVVYQTLKGLYDNDKVEREWDSKAEANRNVLTERSPPAILDEDFEEWAEDNLKDKIETILFPAFENYLSQVLKLASDKRVSDDFIPKKGKDGWCHRCDMSHEAEFFFLALLYHAAYRFVWSPDDWKFADKGLGNRIARLYADNKLGDPKELGV